MGNGAKAQQRRDRKDADKGVAKSQLKAVCITQPAGGVVSGAESLTFYRYRMPQPRPSSAKFASRHSSLPPNKLLSRSTQRTNTARLTPIAFEYGLRGSATSVLRGTISGRSQSRSISTRQYPMKNQRNKHLEQAKEYGRGNCNEVNELNRVMNRCFTTCCWVFCTLIYLIVSFFYDLDGLFAVASGVVCYLISM